MNTIVSETSQQNTFSNLKGNLLKGYQITDRHTKYNYNMLCGITFNTMERVSWKLWQ